MHEVIIVTDLGPGDGGKGNIVHTLSYEKGASVIIKRGGAQGSHGVRTSNGDSFNFSEWGCGTFEGIPTFLSEQIIISPVSLENESEALKQHDIANPFLMLQADPNCLCATPYHRIASELEEIKRKDNPRGTVGTGVGQAYRMYQNLGGEYVIKASELSSKEIILKKLKRELEYYRQLYRNLKPEDVLKDDVNCLEDDLALLDDPDFLPYIVDLFFNIGKKLRLTTLKEVLKPDGIAIVECSHGVLTDAETGLKPHISAIRTLPIFSEQMIRNAGFDGEISHLAVHRAYEIRHGAGPMPTFDENFTRTMLPDSHKSNNRWQGKVRAGPLDFSLMRYALESCKETKFRGIYLTWFDEIVRKKQGFKYSTGYQNSPKNSESYTDFLKNAIPIIESKQIPENISSQELFLRVGGIIKKECGLELECLSIGPTEVEKIYFEK